MEELCDDLDATDGLAAAVCHLYQNQSLNTTKSYNNWDDFLKKNAHRVKK
jgi:crossover junction endodeoxyribonuclease RuvC